MKVGDYVRFDYHRISVPIQIAKVIESHYDNEDDSICYSTDIGLVIDESNLVKEPSPNIIDILEEHDFVQMDSRGNRFYEIEKDYTGKISLRDIGWDEYEELDETNIPDIISIITHEQMEQMKYKVGE